jgi:hypothetical protein
MDNLEKSLSQTSTLLEKASVKGHFKKTKSGGMSFVKQHERHMKEFLHHLKKRSGFAGGWGDSEGVQGHMDFLAHVGKAAHHGKSFKPATANKLGLLSAEDMDHEGAKAKHYNAKMKNYVDTVNKHAGKIHASLSKHEKKTGQNAAHTVKRYWNNHAGTYQWDIDDED